MEYLGVDLVETIKVIGYAGLAVIVFAETGLFLGFFLPGDSLLFVAGFLASQGFFSPFLLASLLFACATLGNMAGYEFGRRIGPKLFSREDSFLFRKQHVERTKRFYDRYGGKTIFLARFVPIVRTFAAILAGVANMRYATFMAYNAIGGFLWSFGLVYLGYMLGSLVTDIDKYLLPIVLGIIVLSFLPGFFHLYQERREMRAAENTKGKDVAE